MLPVGMFFVLLTLTSACIVVVDKDDDRHDLYGTRWVLEFIFYDYDDDYAVHAPEQYTISFETQTEMRGQADCNAFEGNYSVTDEGRISVGRISSTEIGCGRSSIGAEYLSNLRTAREYEIQGDELLIHFGNDRTLRFQRD